MNGYAFHGGYYDSQHYGVNHHDGYENSFITQPPTHNQFHDAQFQEHYPLPSYQDPHSYSQPRYYNPYPQQYQYSQYDFHDQYHQYSPDYNSPQHQFPLQDYSPNPYSSTIHFTPYPKTLKSVRRYELDKETLALAKRWGVTIVPDDDVEDEGYPMRPSEEEYANYQWELQEAFYQEPQQQCQPLDQDSEMKFTMANMLMQLNELQFQLDNMIAQSQGSATQELIQELPSTGEVLQELLLPNEVPNEGHEVEENKMQGENIDGEDEDDEDYDECIEMETPNWKENVELQGNGVKEQHEDDLSEEMLEKYKTCGTNEQSSLMNDTPLDKDFRIIWEPGGVIDFKNFGPQWPIFQSKDSHFLLVHEQDPRLSLLVNGKESQKEKRSGGNDQVLEYYQDPRFRKKTSFDLWIKNGFDERIGLNFEKEQFLSVKVVSLSSKEFIDNHHLKKYLEGKVYRKMGIFLLRSIDG